MIGHEKRIKLAALELLREIHDVFEIKIGIRKGAGITPSASMDRHRPHKGP